jgi:hypothetical protein
MRRSTVGRLMQDAGAMLSGPRRRSYPATRSRAATPRRGTSSAGTRGGLDRIVRRFLRS